MGWTRFSWIAELGGKMSEPGMKLEIEDVLSSIRRLVSQDAPITRAAAMPVVTQEDDADADCLVLTPSLRVVEEPGTPQVQPELDDEVAEATDSEPLHDAPPTEAEADMTEAEMLLADAEAALAETDVVLEDAEAALDEAWGQAVPEAPEVERPLGDELAQLESTIAEMEAAVAESGVEFEPEQGHAFAAEGAAPLVDLPEEFDAETFAEAAEAPEAVAEQAEAGQEQAAEPAEFEVALIEEAELVVPEAAEVPLEEALPALVEVSEEDPDLHDEQWSAAEGGMDWAEAALSLAQGAEPRRLHMRDADPVESLSEAPRSSYAELRDALEGQAEAEFAEAERNLFEEAMIDEAGLRDLVAKLIREELRGALGERITQNVRKLVRREIQRALMGQDLD